MSNYAAIAAVMKKRGVLGTSALGKLEQVITAAATAPALSSVGKSGTVSVKIVNGVAVKAVILSHASKKTAKGNDQQVYNLMITDIGISPIASKDGIRIGLEAIELNISTERPMTEAELAAYAEEMNKKKVPANDDRRKRTKIFELVSPSKIPDSPNSRLMVGTQFVVNCFCAPFTRGDGSAIGVGSFVVISGIQPEMKFPATADGSFGKPEFGVSWKIGSLTIDPLVTAATNLTPLWMKLVKGNFIPNLYKGPGGCWGPQHVSAEEQLKIEEWTKEKNKKKEFAISKFYIDPNLRDKIERLFVIPLGTAPDKIEPWQVAQPYAVRFSNRAYTNWIDKPVGKPQVPMVEFSVDADVIRGEESVQHALVKVTVSAKNTQFNRFGIANPLMWPVIAPFVVPYVGGNIVGRIYLDKSSAMIQNDPLTNPIIEETGKPYTGYDYGVVINVQQIEPNLVNLAFCPNAVQINQKVMLQRLSAYLGIDTAGFVGYKSPWASDNALNSSDRDVLNLMECDTDPSVLSATGYLFFLIFALSSNERRAMKRVQAKIEKEKLNELDVMSTIMGRPPLTEIEASSEDPFMQAPTPDWEKGEFVIFAIREAAIAKYVSANKNLNPEEFVTEVEKIQSELAKIKNPKVVPVVNAPEVVVPPPVDEPEVGSLKKVPDTVPPSEPRKKKGPAAKKAAPKKKADDEDEINVFES